MEITDVEFSFPVEIAAVDGHGQVDVAGCVDAGHDAHGPVLIDVFADHVLRVEPADDAPVRIEARPGHVHHHPAHHVATFRREHQRLRRVHRCVTQGFYSAIPCHLQDHTLYLHLHFIFIRSN